MDINHIKQILNLVREHELTEFEIEHDGLRLKIRKDSAGSPASSGSVVVVPPAVAAAPAPVPAVSGPQAGQAVQPVAVASAAGAAGVPGIPGVDDAAIEL